MQKLVLFVFIGTAALMLVNLFKEEPVLSADAAARAGNRLVMYTTTHCPYCAEARAWLKKNNVAYRECNTDVSEACSDQLARLGANGVPTLVYKDKMHVGWDAAWLSKVLDES